MTERYNITGMSCAACSASVNRVVSRLQGVNACDVNLITGKMTVSFDENKVGSADFVRVVEKAGFGISLENTLKKEAPKPQKSSPLPIIISAVFSALLLYISMGQMLFENLPLPAFINMNTEPYNFALTQLLLCLPAIIVGKKFFTNGFPLLFRGHPNMDSLIAVGASAAFIYSTVMTYTISHNPHAVHNLYYESVAVVITLVMLGKLLEQKSRAKTTDAIKKLMELAPETAIVLRGGKEYTVPTEAVAVGDILIVKAGAKIPLDGIVNEGASHCDEAMLTGESLPIEKNVGDRVTGGSINIDGLLKITVTHTGADTTLSKIIGFVEEAQAKKAPISKVADKVAGVFVPIVMAIATASALIWLIATKDIALSLKIFTSVLVVACPCALGLATPTAIMVGTGLGAQNGILIRNGEVLEAAHRVKAAVFDKTGTITEGRPAVTDIIAEDNEYILQLAASAEAGSQHPLALAITEKASGEKNTLATPDDFQSISGGGVKCRINGREIMVGSLKLLVENGISAEAFSQVSARLGSEGKSLVFVAENGKALGLIAIADSIKPTSKKAFGQLKKAGIKVILLSGDNKACAEHIGAMVGADEVYSEVLPNQKAEIISKIRKTYGTVMMVGDGINDAPALAEADIGCAIGSGSDIAIEAADIVLMKNDPCDVARAVTLSRLTLTNIKQNLFWAFCYNTVLIPVAAGLLYAFGGPLLSPMLGGLAMSLSSVFVVGNALRLRGKKL